MAMARAYCTLRPVCVICGKHHDSAHCTTNKSDPNTKKCGHWGGNHKANYRGCPIYGDLKSRLHPRVTPVRLHNKQSTLKPAEVNPDVFFSTAKRSSFGPGITSQNVTFANVLKSGLTKPSATTTILHTAQIDPTPNPRLPTQQQSNMETMMHTLQHEYH